MIIGILVADPALAELREEFGNYSQMFMNLLNEGAQGEELQFRHYNVMASERPQNLDECDGYISTGSRASVYDDEAWIRNLERLTIELHEVKKKHVGICFGHQMIARALGGCTEPAQPGWGVGVHTSEVIEDDYYMSPASREISLLVSHKDQVTRLPENAKLMARSDFCPIAMFQIDDHVLALQGHPEFVKGYSRGVMNIRREILGEKVYTEGIESLQNPTSEQVVARWIVQFFKGRPLITDSVRSSLA
jgi:GMP synthase (glutamine-hydrolysing)